MKFLSRKLLITLLTNVLAVYMAFGGYITPEQTAAILALVNTTYVIVNGYVETKVAGV
jgi:hypothetical protein